MRKVEVRQELAGEEATEDYVDFEFACSESAAGVLELLGRDEASGRTISAEDLGEKAAFTRSRAGSVAKLHDGDVGPVAAAELFPGL